MNTIQVISSCLVRATTNIHDHAIANNKSSRIELTPWGLQFLPLDPIQKGLLFQKPYHNNNSTNSNNNNNSPPNQDVPTLIHHLKSSLSQTLEFFPPLAGRLSTTTSPNDTTTVCYFVNCNNAGVEFTHAVAREVCVSDILEPTYVPAEIVESFFPLNGFPNYEGVSKPLLGVQVTELSDGLFIGCTMNHVVADGTSFWHFFNSWSEISRGFHMISKTNIFERPFPSIYYKNVPIHNRPIPIRDPFLIEKQNLSSCITKPDPHELIEKVFHFSKESIAKLKASANSEVGTEYRKISSLQALSVHLWRSVIRGRVLTNQISQKQEVKFTVVVGARGRIPLPDGYFGTAVYAVILAMSANELLQDNGLDRAGSKLNQLVARQTSEEVVQFVEDWVKNPTLLRRGVTSFVISSSPRFNVYGCDFGWGKPVAVRCGMGQKSDGKMTVFPAEEPGGIQVHVCLSPETMKVIEDDAEFMEAVTSN